jgi:hypothetical protein
MAKKYVVDLNEGEKADLVALIQKGRSGSDNLSPKLGINSRNCIR